MKLECKTEKKSTHSFYKLLKLKIKLLDHRYNLSDNSTWTLLKIRDIIVYKNSLNKVFIVTCSVSKASAATGLKAKRLRVINCHEELNWTEQTVSFPLFMRIFLEFVFIPCWPLCFRCLTLLMTTDKIYWMEETNN